MGEARLFIAPSLLNFIQLLHLNQTGVMEYLLGKKLF
jgi:hypothetical protein